MEFGGSFGWGLLAGSSLVVGAVIAFLFRIPLRVIGLIMGFGAGVLISAVAFDLVDEAVDKSLGKDGTVAGLFAGCLVFFAGDRLIDRLGGGDRKDANRGGEEERVSALDRARNRAGRDPGVDGDRPGDLRGRRSGRRLPGCGLHLQRARVDLRDLRPPGQRLEEVTNPLAVDRDRAGLRPVLAGRLRPLPGRLAGRGRVRPHVRGRRDPDHAGQHDDARGLRARRQARRDHGDARVRGRVHDHLLEVSA